jgi:hypothetical protein
MSKQKSVYLTSVLRDFKITCLATGLKSFTEGSPEYIVLSREIERRQKKRECERARNQKKRTFAASLNLHKKSASKKMMKNSSGTESNDDIMDISENDEVVYFQPLWMRDCMLKMCLGVDRCSMNNTRFPIADVLRPTDEWKTNKQPLIANGLEVLHFSQSRITNYKEDVDYLPTISLCSLRDGVWLNSNVMEYYAQMLVTVMTT